MKSKNKQKGEILMGGFTLDLENQTVPMDDIPIPDKSGLYYDIFEEEGIILSPKRIQSLKDEFCTFVVNEFGDDYHVPEEKRREENQFYSEFVKLNKMKKKYKQLDEFVICYRQVLKCLQMVAETNMLYDPLDFMQRWFMKKIKITGLFFPEYKGKDKKNINWDYVVHEYIFNEENDPSELVEERVSLEEFNDGLDEQEGYQYYTQEELDELLDGWEWDPKKIRERRIKELKEGKCDCATHLSAKKVRKLLKERPEVLQEAERIQKERKKARKRLKKTNKQLVTMFGRDNFERSDFEVIEKYDRERNQKEEKKLEESMPTFTGNIFSKKEFKKYQYDFDEWYKDNDVVIYASSIKTPRSVEELEIKSWMEEAGWNIRAFYKNPQKMTKRKKEGYKKRIKRIREKEEGIKNRLIEQQQKKDKLRKKLGKGKKKDPREGFDDEMPKWERELIKEEERKHRKKKEKKKEKKKNKKKSERQRSYYW